MARASCSSRWAASLDGVRPGDSCGERWGDGRVATAGLEGRRRWEIVRLVRRPLLLVEVALMVTVLPEPALTHRHAHTHTHTRTHTHTQSHKVNSSKRLRACCGRTLLASGRPLAAT